MSCSQGEYARLGKSCGTSMRVLIDNRKFLPPQAHVYKPAYTTMYQYPGQSYDYITTVGDPERPEDIKTKQPQNFGLQKPPGENYKPCCGRK